MSTLTPNYSFVLPAVNSPTDEDLWGDENNANWSAIDTDLKTVSDAAAAAATANRLPVGSLYFNASVATNPATLLGYGTWTSFGAGRVILGVGTSSADINGETLTVAAGATGGEFNHTLITAEMPAHTHGAPNDFLIASGGLAYATGGGTATGATSTTSSTGGGLKHNNIQPYIGVYVWLRTA